MQPIAHAIEENDDGEILMLCSDQHKGRMPEKISTGTSECHVFEIDFWCVFAGIEESEGRWRKKYGMTKEETILFQKGDQYLEELVDAKLDNKDKKKLSILRKYDEELEMLEDWFINPRIDKNDSLMLNCGIGKE